MRREYVDPREDVPPRNPHPPSLAMRREAMDPREDAPPRNPCHGRIGDRIREGRLKTGQLFHRGVSDTIVLVECFFTSMHCSGKETQIRYD